MCTMLHSDFFYLFYFTCIRPLYRAAWSRCVREGAAVLAISVTHLHYIDTIRYYDLYDDVSARKIPLFFVYLYIYANIYVWSTRRTYPHLVTTQNFEIIGGSCTYLTDWATPPRFRRQYPPARPPEPWTNIVTWRTRHMVCPGLRPTRWFGLGLLGRLRNHCHPWRSPSVCKLPTAIVQPKFHRYCHPTGTTSPSPRCQVL